MSGSAELAKAQIRAAISNLQTTRLQVISAKSHVTDIGISLNTSSNATSDAIGQQLNAIRQLQDAIQQVQFGLIGTADIAATEALVWLERANQDLADDAVKLNQMKNEITATNLHVAGVITNQEQDISHITGAISRLTAHLSVLG